MIVLIVSILRTFPVVLVTPTSIRCTTGERYAPSVTSAKCATHAGTSSSEEKLVVNSPMAPHVTYVCMSTRRLARASRSPCRVCNRSGRRCKKFQEMSRPKSC
ncbi:hypothetical protein BD626DRAFT_49673 [Schizophyllum amplum]|uniref:Zn(2)-C6 fungal-type domain-containing protein n=1 Tax=Schizophyllum amplum TaxID=97359 RepID=A0A550CCD3_9AGAR|nr:hypothetical protein BD626DRAFT_49673 [Auriculariopsis ampla]